MRRYLSARDRKARPLPYHGGLGASRAYTRDHPRHCLCCESAWLTGAGCSRDVALVVSDVSVLCPRLVAELHNDVVSALVAVLTPQRSLVSELDFCRTAAWTWSMRWRTPGG